MAGQMGSGIAQVAAMAGIHVALCDTSPLVIQAAAENLEVSLNSLVSQDKISPAIAKATARRIIRSTDIQASSRMTCCPWKQGLKQGDIPVSRNPLALSAGCLHIVMCASPAR